MLTRRSFVKNGLMCAAAASLPSPHALAAAVDRTLYNGIVLPRRGRHGSSSRTSTPITPPYLADPPAVIPIDVGRQLFVDDFLIEETTLERTCHHAGRIIRRARS